MEVTTGGPQEARRRHQVARAVALLTQTGRRSARELLPIVSHLSADRGKFGCGGVQPAVLAAVERGGVKAKHSDPSFGGDFEKSNIARIADELRRRRRDAL